MNRSLPASSVIHEQPFAMATTRAIELALMAKTQGGDGPLRDVMQQICDDARQLGMRPEELIIVFKTRWSAHPALRALAREDANAALDHLITTCIEEFYRTD